MDGQPRLLRPRTALIVAVAALLTLVTLGSVSPAVTREPRSASGARMAAAVLMGGIVLGNAANL
jgi:hypothetical protein